MGRNLRRSEILDFVRRDYPHYAWSIPTLDRRLRHFSIQYIDKDTSLEEVLEAVDKELDGPGQLLGYRSMNQKLRTEHDIKVPRHVVHSVMRYLDPDGIENRFPRNERKRSNLLFLMALTGCIPLMAIIS